ncbi:uncharacterized protein K02A2.6-like [Lutzomyia longipalpis]|uniref:uncharacterized protein K02A2.6-like n=1 Tax=Lutzomyia longipalpis TaxID=7200 RepID=UPI002483DC09|nr:uncharacterized protein K02A2.6-like [Lutzomyia longipalpis]
MATEKALLEAIKATHEFMQEQARQTQAQHKDLISALQRFELNRPTQPELTIEALSSTIDAFSYDPDNNVTFDLWYSKYEDVFIEDTRALDDAGRTRLLLRRLDNVAHARYANYILPAAPRDKNFEATVTILRKIFGKGESVFAKRWKCLQMQKIPHDDFTTYAGKVNRACEDFQLSNVTPDYFKCLIFLLGLQGETYTEVRRRLLNKLATEDPSAVNLELMVTEAKHFLNLRKDSDLIGNPTANFETLGVNEVQGQKGDDNSNQQKRDFAKSEKKVPKSPCWLCGSMHYVRECSYLEHTCADCKRKGHREGYCEVSANKAAHSKHNSNSPAKANAIDNTSFSRKYISVTINGKTLSLLYDTGADITIISQKNWQFLGSPSLTSVSALPKDAQGNNIRLLGEFHPHIAFNLLSKQGRCVVAKGDINLFGTDWISLFNLWDTPISQICNVTTPCGVTSSQRGIPRVFSITLGRSHNEVTDPTLPCSTYAHTSALLAVKSPEDYIPIHNTLIFNKDSVRSAWPSFEKRIGCQHRLNVFGLRGLLWRTASQDDATHSHLFI